MSTTIRSLFAVAILFAGTTGCAVDSDQEEAATEENAEEQDKSDETSDAKLEEAKLALQKKRVGINARRESPKK